MLHRHHLDCIMLLGELRAFPNVREGLNKRLKPNKFLMLHAAILICSTTTYRIDSFINLIYRLRFETKWLPGSCKLTTLSALFYRLG